MYYVSYCNIYNSYCFLKFFLMFNVVHTNNVSITYCCYSWVICICKVNTIFIINYNQVRWTCVVYNFILHGVEHMQLWVGAMFIRPSMFKCKPFSLCWTTVSIYTCWYIHTTWQCGHACYHISCRLCLFFCILTTMFCFIMPMFFTHINTYVRTHIYLYSHSIYIGTEKH